MGNMLFTSAFAAVNLRAKFHPESEVQTILEFTPYDDENWSSSNPVI